MPVVDDRANRQARNALIQLLEERPEFKDSKSNNIQDLMPFLEIEENSEKWLPYFHSNVRALSSIWHNLIKNGGEKVQVQEEFESTSSPAAAVPAPKEAVLAPAKNKASSKRESQAQPAAVKPEQLQLHVEAAEQQKSLPKAHKEQKTTEDPLPLPVEGEVEPVHYELVVQSAPQPLEERTLEESRMLAEQFAIVQYHEQRVEQAARTVEELTEALSRAKQAQIITFQAYNNALEDLARLMATSLGQKAGDFSKLLSRIVNTQQVKK